MSAPVALRDAADSLLESSRACGADAADVIVAEGISLNVGVRLREVEKLKRARAKHLGLRVFVGKSSATTSTADFTRDGLGKLAEETVALARITAPDPFAGLPESAELATEIPDFELYDQAVGEVSVEAALDQARAAEAAALATDARVTNSEGAEYTATTNRTVYGSSGGFRGEYRSSSATLSCVPVVSQNGAMQRDYWFTSQRWLSRMDSPDDVGRQAARRAVRRLGARSVATCEAPVIFDPLVAGSLIGHIASAVSGYALYKRTSFLLGKLGQKIAPDFVTVVDDGTIPRGLGSKPFDGEGLPTRRTVVVDRGVLRAYLFDSYAARKMDAKSTGNAARGIGDAPRVAPTNFVLEAGTTPPEEILRSVRSGLYVTEFIGFGVNQVNGDYSRGAVGLWIENGEIAYPVEEITIAGNLLDMYQRIDVVGDDLDYRRSIVAPTVKIDRMTIAGG